MENQIVNSFSRKSVLFINHKSLVSCLREAFELTYKNNLDVQLLIVDLYGNVHLSKELKDDEDKNFFVLHHQISFWIEEGESVFADNEINRSLEINEMILKELNEYENQYFYTYFSDVLFITNNKND